MNFNEFIEMKIKEANDYACGVTDNEQCIAEDAWRAGKLEAAQHILDMRTKGSTELFSDWIDWYVEGLK